MSTILKALKKLEHEKPDESITYAGSRKSTTRETLGRRAKRFVQLHKYFWVFVGLGAVALAAWLIYIPLFSDSRHSVTTADSDQAVRINPKTASVPPLAKQNQKPAQVKEALPDKSAPVNRSQKKSTKKKVSRKAATSRKRTQSLKPRRTGLPPKVLDSKPVSVQPLEDSKLKLQAISWSQNRDDRIAVINGSIMREGESIEGFRIIEIGQDDVVVRSGQDDRKLVFGFK